MIKVGDFVKIINPNLNHHYGKIYQVFEVDPCVYDEQKQWVMTVDHLWFETSDFVLTPSPASTKLEATFAATEWSKVVEEKVVFNAPVMLKRAADIMQERGKQYDSPEGERSMEQIVKAFNIITKNQLTESQGWLFMVLLKMVRDNARDKGHQDSCEDLIAYASLYGESRLS